MKHLLISLLAFTAPAYCQVAQPRLTPPKAGPLRPPMAAPVTPAPSPAPSAAVRFHDVDVQGATIISADAIARQFAGLRDRDVSTADLKNVLDTVVALYAAAGYPLGRATVPAQRRGNGTLIVKVVEGYVGGIAVTANDRRAKTLVESAAAPLLRERPLTRKTLERVLLLLQEIPGLTLTAKFDQTDLHTGATPLLLDVTPKPVTFGIALDNRSGFSGLPVQPYATLTLNNMLGWGDQIGITALVSPRQNDYAFYAASLSRLVGPSGLRVGLDGSWAQALDEVSVRPYAVRARVEQASLKTRYPLIRSSTESLNTQARVIVTNARYNLAGSVNSVIAHDGIVALEWGADYARAFSQAFGVGAGLTLTQGVDSFSGEPHTRLRTIPAFTRLRAEARAVWTPLKDVSLKLTAQGQASPDSLIASEEIAFGGLNFGRGFQPAEISGDKGAGVSFQPEYKIHLGERWSVTPYLLGDYAKVWQKHGDGQSQAELVSAGGGARLGLAEIAEVTLEADKPINRVPLDRGDKAWRFHAGVEIGLDRVASFIAGSL